MQLYLYSFGIILLSLQSIWLIGYPLHHSTLLFHLFFNKEPDFRFLKTFGCACFPLLKPYYTHKLDFRSQECVFLGYSSSHKGNKCLSSTGRIYISKDVLVNELMFPYLDLFSSPFSSTQNITSYFSLNPDLSPTVSASTPSLSQYLPPIPFQLPLFLLVSLLLP